MKPSTTVAAFVAFFVGAAFTFAAERWLEVGKPEMALVVGAVLGVNVGAVFQHRSRGGDNTAGVKAVLGLVLAAAAAAFGLVVHWLYAPFQFVEVSVPISAVGAFCFPFALFNIMWSALEKTRK
jgi:hypothetical protein